MCEMANEWAPMLQPLVIDSGAAETERLKEYPHNKLVQRQCCPMDCDANRSKHWRTGIWRIKSRPIGGLRRRTDTSGCLEIG